MRTFAGTIPKPFLLLAHKTLGHAILALSAVGVLGGIDFSGSVTLGSVLIAVVIAAMAAFYTLRSKIAEVWRQEAEGEKAAKDRLQGELDEEKSARAEEARQQQELRHGLKDEIAGLKSQIKVMEAKTDLTVALETIRQMNAELAATVAASIVEVMKGTSQMSEERDTQTHRLLEEIRDKLPSEPITVVAAPDLESSP